MKGNRVKWLCLFAASATLLTVSSCGLAETKAKRQFTQELFEKYPTMGGDMAWDYSIIKSREQVGDTFVFHTDTFLVVKNGEEFWRVKKDGTRIPVTYVKYRK